jgi:dTDP-4-dehydrorhamnose 3,5-epimerase-like enzyme
MSPPQLAALIELPVVADPRGKLCFAESQRHVPFEIARVYYLYDVPAGAVRAGHAHLALHQLLLPLSGSFDVRLHDGRREEVFTLNRPNIGLHIGPMTWRELENFSSAAVCMVMASTPYDEADYIRDFATFLGRAGG